MRDRFDLVVLDMDGTIYGRQFPGGFSPRVRRAIAAVQNAGTPVTIATGRIFDFVRTIAPDLGITLPVITAQGAVIGDPVSGELLYESLIPPGAARRAARWADSEDRTTVFYLNQPGGRTRLVQNFSPAANGAGGLEGWDTATYDHWFGSPRELCTSLLEVMDDADVRPLKFITVNDFKQEADLTAPLQTRFGSDLLISRSHQLLVEGTAPTANKGDALKLLAGRLNVDPARVLAVGDNENDIPMMRVAGFAVAMGQATAVVQQEADWVAPSLAQDGAAVALERFLIA